MHIFVHTLQKYYIVLLAFQSVSITEGVTRGRESVRRRRNLVMALSSKRVAQIMTFVNVVHVSIYLYYYFVGSDIFSLYIPVGENNCTAGLLCFVA